MLTLGAQRIGSVRTEGSLRRVASSSRDEEPPVSCPIADHGPSTGDDSGPRWGIDGLGALDAAVASTSALVPIQRAPALDGRGAARRTLAAVLLATPLTGPSIRVSEAGWGARRAGCQASERRDREGTSPRLPPMSPSALVRAKSCLLALRLFPRACGSHSDAARLMRRSLPAPLMAAGRVSARWHQNVPCRESMRGAFLYRRRRPHHLA
mgnify:CR=1 FL=1